MMMMAPLANGMAYTSRTRPVNIDGQSNEMCISKNDLSTSFSVLLWGIRGNISKNTWIRSEGQKK